MALPGAIPAFPARIKAAPRTKLMQWTNPTGDKDLGPDGWCAIPLPSAGGARVVLHGEGNAEDRRTSQRSGSCRRRCSLTAAMIPQKGRGGRPSETWSTGSSEHTTQWPWFPRAFSWTWSWDDHSHIKLPTWRTGCRHGLLHHRRGLVVDIEKPAAPAAFITVVPPETTP